MKTTDSPNHVTLGMAIDSSCRRIAPTWPLDRFIAVNPYWGWVDHPFEQAAAQLSRLAGSSMYLPREYYARAFREKRFNATHLRKALEEAGLANMEAAAVSGLDETPDSVTPLPLLSDVLDSRRDLTREPAWRNTITHEISQFCGAFFDREQADWHLPEEPNLFAGWRSTIGHDRGIGLLMKAPEVTARAQTLPEESREAIAFVLERLGVPMSETTELLTAVLLRINGWAAWCAYLGWQARLEGKEDSTLVDLLAIRLAWEFLLDDGRRDAGSVWAEWQNLAQTTFRDAVATGPNLEGLYHRALEIAYQSQLCAALSGSSATGPQPNRRDAVQAAFCIDVRSEVFRRALEAVGSDIRTLGFAGFFGLPIEYAPLGTEFRRPQLPGLLAPALCVTDTCGHEEGDRYTATARAERLSAVGSKRPFKRLPGSAFTLVETLGLGYAARLVSRSLPFTTTPPALPEQDGLKRGGRLRPVLGNDLPGRADLAEKILRGMSLTSGFARLVLLVGHGSTSANNPHAAGLDCGACCGQTGEVNARVLASLLNEAPVRRALGERNIVIPEDTFFLAGLHNTTTDIVELFETEFLPVTHAADLAQIQARLAEAGRRVRAERAASLGLAAVAGQPDALFRAVQMRSADWGQTRPEWGLANNAAFIVAPRSRTRDIDLQGRAFLHDYDWRIDPDCSILELIMTAPMVVTNWINMQYYASTVDNPRYGSGNKVLHNVVGGHIGVFEGNGGDLRIGLSMQSLHDGEQWRHTPLRLSVFIEAPRAGIEGVISSHQLVRHLIDHGWIHLLRIDPDDSRVEVYEKGSWKPPHDHTGS